MSERAAQEEIGPASKGLIVLCSHSIHDPLVATLMLDYIIRLQSQYRKRTVLFITEEPEFRKDLAETAEQLAGYGLQWSPLRYDHRQPFQWWHKAMNALRVLRRSARFRRAYPESAVIGFLSVAGAYALLVKALLGFTTGITFCFEPHSLYMREVGVWPSNGLKFRFTSWMERQQVRRMDVLVVPTQAGLRQVTQLGRKKRTELLGITINVQGALFSKEARRHHRGELGWGDDPVFIYVGKFGGIYHSVDQYLAFAQQVLTMLPEARFAVITHREWKQELELLAKALYILDRFVVLPPVPPEGLAAVLSAADFGVVAIPPTPSQIYRTPVKTAHYWAAGLPIVIPKGVSDDGHIALENGTGIVVDDLPTFGTASFLEQIKAFRAVDADVLRERCMNCAMHYRDTSLTVDLLDRILP